MGNCRTNKILSAGGFLRWMLLQWEAYEILLVWQIARLIAHISSSRCWIFCTLCALSLAAVSLISTCKLTDEDWITMAIINKNQTFT